MIAPYRHVKQTCPQCGEPALRIPRRLVDRLTSLVHPVQRYQCTALECEWQGNLPRHYAPHDPGLAPLSTPTGTR